MQRVPLQNRLIWRQKSKRDDILQTNKLNSAILHVFCVVVSNPVEEENNSTKKMDGGAHVKRTILIPKCSNQDEDDGNGS